MFDSTTMYVPISNKSNLNLTFNLHQCGKRQIISGSDFKIDSSDSFVFVYLNSGNAVLKFSGISYFITESSGFFAFPDVEYELINQGDSPLLITWLSFSGYLVERYLNRASIYRATPAFNDSSGEIGERFAILYNTSLSMPNRYCKMMSVLYDIFSRLIDKNPEERATVYMDDSNITAAKAVEFIERNFNKLEKVEDVADHLGISRKHLCEIFKDVFKITPKQYLIYYRIERACVRLKTSTMTVYEVSESVGYSNQFYFAKEFKRLLGQTPSEYRKNPDKREVFSFKTFYGAMNNTGC